MINKKEVINTYKLHDTDNGSIEVQVALLTHRINDLNKHSKENKKDYSCKRGLMILVGRRRRFLQYLKSSDEAQYYKVIAQLGIRG
ncbi:MAG: 30S ribosomal protein S15 [Candidatus Babeliaceae bacterium]